MKRTSDAEAPLAKRVQVDDSFEVTFENGIGNFVMNRKEDLEYFIEQNTWHLTVAFSSHANSDKVAFLSKERKVNPMRVTLRPNTNRTKIYWIVHSAEIKGLAQGWHLRFRTDKNTWSYKQLPQGTTHIFFALPSNADVFASPDCSTIRFRYWERFSLHNLPHSLFIDRLTEQELGEVGSYLLVIPYDKDGKILGGYIIRILSFQAVHQRDPSPPRCPQLPKKAEQKPRSLEDNLQILKNLLKK